MEMAESVSAADLVNNLGRYKLQAQREAVPVSSPGHVVGYLLTADE